MTDTIHQAQRSRPEQWSIMCVGGIYDGRIFSLPYNATREAGDLVIPPFDGYISAHYVLQEAYPEKPPHERFVAIPRGWMWENAIARSTAYVAP